MKILGIVYFYSIWSLSLFSRSFIRNNQKNLSWFTNRSTFSYNLNFLGFILNVLRLLRRNLFRTNFIFRVLISIPLFILFFSQI